MTYDLRRLRLNGLIRRLPHTNHYVLTADGIRIAVFYTKIYNRLLVPLTAANQPQAPPSLGVPPTFRTADPLGFSAERTGSRGREIPEVLT
jgi:hypothetical protein